MLILADKLGRLFWFRYHSSRPYEPGRILSRVGVGRAVDMVAGCWLAFRRGRFAGGREPLAERGGA